MINYHGRNKRRNYFEGWYLKHQKGKDMVSVIPGVHIDENGKKSAFIQIITSEQSYPIEFDYSMFQAAQSRFAVRIGRNRFSDKGMFLNIKRPGIDIKARIEYAAMRPIKYDIMGPFKYIPFMECNHGVISMNHKCLGYIRINGKSINLNSGNGYIEKDWGCSFPKSYLWTQCNSFKKTPASIMVSIADIPMGCLSFNGLIGVIYYRGKEYRFATYLGVQVLRKSKSGFFIKQGNMTLEVKIIAHNPHELLAPKKGSMSRTIHENIACYARYQFTINNHIVFDLESEQASYEWVDITTPLQPDMADRSYVQN